MSESKLQPPAKITEKLEPGFCQDQAQYIANHVYQPLKHEIESIRKESEEALDIIHKSVLDAQAIMEESVASSFLVYEEESRQNKLLKTQVKLLKKNGSVSAPSFADIVKFVEKAIEYAEDHKSAAQTRLQDEHAKGQLYELHIMRQFLKTGKEPNED